MIVSTVYRKYPGAICNFNAIILIQEKIRNILICQLLCTKSSTHYWYLPLGAPYFHYAFMFNVISNALRKKRKHESSSQFIRISQGRKIMHRTKIKKYFPKLPEHFKTI